MSLSYRPAIDGLRAVAVLSVIAFHAGVPGVPGGFVGVDIFFVISGYLITGLLFEEWMTKGRISLASFFARRVRRLLPALLLVSACTLLLSVWLVFPQELPRLGKSATAMLFLAANVHFHHYSGGYFDPSTDVMPLLHTWSLSVEEQYYLVWPLILIVCGRLATRFTGVTFLRLAGLALAVLAVASFGAFVAQAAASRSAAFYLVQYRAWEFAAGGLALLASRRWQPGPGVGSWVAAAGMLAVGIAVATFDERVRFPGPAAALPVLGTAAALMGAAGSGAGPVQRLLAAPPLVRVGLLSYSLYLWHWPLLALVRAYHLAQRDPWRDGLAVAAAFILAALTHRWVENPIRYGKPGWFARPRTTLLAGFLMSFAVLLVGQGVIHWGKHANGVFNQQHQASAAAAPFCHEEGKMLAARTECTVGPGTAPPSILVWGDSHAEHLRPAFESPAGNPPSRALFRFLASCPPLEGAAPLIKGEFQHDCLRFNDAVAGEWGATPGFGIHGVVLAARWNMYLAQPSTDPGGITSYGLADVPPDPQAPPQTTAAAAYRLEAALRRTVAHLGAAGLKVLLVAPMPEMVFHVPQCVYRRSEPACVVGRDRVDMRRRIAVDIMRRIAAEFPHVRFADPIAEFCDAAYCFGADGGMLRYSDDNHLTPAMATKLGQRWAETLAWLATAGSDSPHHGK